MNWPARSLDLTLSEHLLDDLGDEHESAMLQQLALTTCSTSCSRDGRRSPEPGPTLPGLPALRDARLSAIFSSTRTFGVAHCRRRRWLTLRLTSNVCDLDR